MAADVSCYFHTVYVCIAALMPGLGDVLSMLYLCISYHIIWQLTDCRWKRDSMALEEHFARGDKFDGKHRGDTLFIILHAHIL